MKRNHSVDLVRIIASFGVIAIHVKSDTPAASLFATLFWPLCVPFFLTSSVFYFIKSVHKSHSLKDNILKIGKRLYIPFIVWSIIYTVLLIVENVATHQNKEFSFWRIFVYGNSSVQLYFQPLLINIQLLILGSIFLARKKSLIAILLILLSLTFFVIGDMYDCFGFGLTSQNVGMISYIIFGYLILTLTAQYKKQVWYIVSGLLLLVIIYLSLFNSSFSISVGGYWVLFPFGGLALLLLCLGINIPTLPKWVESTANNTYGIYLCHIVFLEAFELLSNKVLKHMEYTLANKFIFTLCIFLAANFFIELTRKIALSKKLLLGES